MPEASTTLYSGNVNRNKLNSVQILQWQEDMLRTIFYLENVYENLAIHEVRIIKTY